MSAGGLGAAGALVCFGGSGAERTTGAAAAVSVFVGAAWRTMQSWTR
jgi:hypothetical protein